MSGIPSKSARMKEFFRRLAAAPAAANDADALALVCDTLNRVEDELTGIPFNPDDYKKDGRMYPPQPDREFATDDRPDVRQFLSVGHITAIGRDGSIEIRDRHTGALYFAKPGGHQSS